MQRTLYTGGISHKVADLVLVMTIKMSASTLLQFSAYRSGRTKVKEKTEPAAMIYEKFGKMEKIVLK